MRVPRGEIRSCVDAVDRLIEALSSHGTPADRLRGAQGCMSELAITAERLRDRLNGEVTIGQGQSASGRTP